ncbi:unnamed protein product, partial [marine sediment metagenome]
HGISDFFDIGRNGVCHALFPEKGFVRPGSTIIMGDSHTCTYGAFGAFAAGVGTTDLEVGILKGVCAFHYPKTMKINIHGPMPAGVFAKDVILSIIAKIGVAGATDKIIELAGPVVDEMNMEARMTLCNMVVEAGATCGICYPDEITVDYLWQFIRSEYPTKTAALKAYQQFLPDPEADIKKIADTMTPGPIAHNFALGGRFGILGGGDMIDDCFYLVGIEHPVFTPGYQIIDGNRCGNFVTEYGVQTQDIYVTGRVVDIVRVKNLFRDGFSHGIRSDLVSYK